MYGGGEAGKRLALGYRAKAQAGGCGCSEEKMPQNTGETMKKIGRLASYFLALAILLTSILPLYVAAEPGTGGFSIEKLLVDNVENPVGIDNEDPNFSWNMVSGGRNVSQSAYRITVNAWDVLKGVEGARVCPGGRIPHEQRFPGGLYDSGQCGREKL